MPDEKHDPDEWRPRNTQEVNIVMDVLAGIPGQIPWSHAQAMVWKALTKQRDRQKLVSRIAHKFGVSHMTAEGILDTIRETHKLVANEPGRFERGGTDFGPLAG